MQSFALQTRPAANLLRPSISAICFERRLSFKARSSGAAPWRHQPSHFRGGSRLFATLIDPPRSSNIRDSLPPKGSALSSRRDLPLLEQYIYDRIQTVPASASLGGIYEKYRSNAGHVLDSQLPYEPRPNSSRRVGPAEDDGVVLVAHVAVSKNGRCRISLSSGFALDSEGADREQCVVTCCHTLEEIARSIEPSSLSSPSGIYIFPSSRGAPPIPVSGVLSSLPRHDILLLSIPPTCRLRTLPLSPYPAPGDSTLSIRLFSSPGRPEAQGADEWMEWLDRHALRKWVQGGKVLGYRDFAGRESKTGTYDALSHMLFDILPTPGSSGAPLVDEYGAVVGMALGTRMDNRVEGNRGWGVPAELIFEMFSLPGLKLNKKN
ncbi:trypsin-like peptidase domain protein [Ceratobasidium sp. AG-Ba]|nr:trypsin-like peptidase domain protein [Ceratobasidium sp. AG-Ba]